MNKDFKALLGQKGLLFVFDMDGVITEARWGKDSVLSPVGADLKITNHLEKDFYKKVKHVQPITKLIKGLDDDCVRVLSKVSNSVESIQKIKCLNKIFKRSSTDWFVGAKDDSEKLEVLIYWAQQFKGVVYVDDNLESLIFLETEIAKRGIEEIKLFHVSSLFVELEH